MTILFFLMSSWALAITPLDWGIDSLQVPRIFHAQRLAGTDSYRMGDEWGKVAVTPDQLQSDLILQRVAQSTGRVGGGTGFYLGRFQGKHVMATNHHVCPTTNQCLGSRVNFTTLGITATISDFYGTWTDVDLALFELTVDPKSEAALVPAPFAYQLPLRPGQKLLTAGYGSAGNFSRRLVANQDSDCVVFSREDEFRFMADPDALNPGTYKAWSFANGCDVSHGDSGSAMVDRESGKVVGIIWTGRIPKNPNVQSSNYLKGLLENPTEEVWEELSYGVPAIRIQEHLQDLVAKGQVAPKHRAVLSAVAQ